MLFYGQDIRIDFSVLLSIYDMCAEPLGDRRAHTVAAISVFEPYLHIRSLVCLWHLAYNVFAHGADEDAFIPAQKVVEKQQLFIFQPYTAYDVLVHNIGEEVLRQPFGIDDLFARLFQVFDDVRYGIAQHICAVYRPEIRSAERFVEV